MRANISETSSCPSNNHYFCGINSLEMQDTVKPAIIVQNDTLKHTGTTAPVQAVAPSAPHKSTAAAESAMQEIDTVSVCERNPVADITFYDSLNFVREKDYYTYSRFPYSFIEKNNERLEQSRAILMGHLKPGLNIPARPFHHDWFLAIILLAAFLYSVIRTTSKTMLPEVARFLLFRGINDPSSRDIGGLFNWQATLLNLITFFNTGLFFYNAAQWYGALPQNIPGYLVWLLMVGIVIFMVTLRHFICVVTGNITSQQEVFREYLLGIYQSYRLSGIILFVIVILISYTEIFPVKFLVLSGFATLLLMYSIRIIRLFLIFINRNISIFYLILYLCSLEILPFLILLKYSFGRF